MPINILMPALSPTMTEGNVSKWLKKEGDAVKAGDVIAEIETDKATMEVEAVDEGKIGKIVVPAGTEGVKVNDVIAVLLEEGESAADIAATPKANPEPAAKTADAKPKAEVPAPQPAAPKPAPAAAPAPKLPAPSGDGKRVFASPLARRIAQQQGIDIASVQGSGPNGRIIRADVAGAVAGGTAKAAPAGGAAQRAASLPAAPSFSGFGEPEFELIPHTTIRKTIARRLQESKQFVPHFYLTVDCEIDRLLALREDANAGSPKEGPNAYKLSVNDFMIKAYALALKAVPKANASWSDEGIKQYRTADISVAVSVPNGLVTPIIRQAESKTLTQISAEMKELAGRAKANKLKPEDYTGGSASLSNLGMFGVKSFSAIINPPQATILAIGAGEQRAVVKSGQLAVATVMSATLAVDHRAVDGALGAELLAAFKRLVEAPAAMLV
ncbi:pyruvate dehydrogenase complex dihydrolipoamide acetyltransferase [Dongia sedimenti]|uniref:Acetyltransferase component of pyruvate dehydrogenase complex n=1 Tax=Dongia sedimenti TaxID=3064282 RepID=A0ABU0YJZ2_9PROT|nr:pyruvate dehydrogenase complex dihydrolipoamide acetyltransferase [Rhodospirillaceae bacterium R-7]